MVTKHPCRFYKTPAGCKQGNKCKYAHIDPTTPSPATSTGAVVPNSQPSTSVQRPDPSATPRFNPSAHVPNLPRGACRSYWSTGRCPQGEGCRFNHIANPEHPPPPETFTTLQSHFQAAGLGSFPSLQNDKFAVGAGTNGTPGETHHLLKKFLEDNFRFQTPSQVYSFLDLICNANTENPNWKPEDGYTHLHNLAKGNGVLRLGDAIRFPEEFPTASWSFQRGYIPLLTYLSSEWVVKSTIHADVNALYGLIHTNFDVLCKIIQSHVSRLMQVRSFKEPGRKSLSGTHVFKVLFTVLFEYLTRFKTASLTNPGVSEFVHQCTSWFDDWVLALGPPPTFDDDCNTYDENIRAFVLKNLDQNKLQVLRIVDRASTRLAKPTKQVTRAGPVSSEALIANLQRICDFDGPGELRDKGPRHDNDHVSIEDIRIAPTHQELMCEDDPYLPPNFPKAPHFLEQKSVERLLDIQFRLLREELIAPIRLAIQLVVADLRRPSNADTLLSKLIKSKGGRYAAPANVQESVIFSVFTGLSFEPLTLNNRGTSVGITFDAPPGKARNKQAATRAAYWEQVAKKRLMQGGLVALIWKDMSESLDIYIGTIASTPKDLVDSSRKYEDQVTLRVSFFDTTAELRIIRALQNRRGPMGTQLLIEAPVFFEGIRPFLEALKKSPDLLPNHPAKLLLDPSVCIPTQGSFPCRFWSWFSCFDHYKRRIHRSSEA
ncbi:Zinc finger, NF-X1-type [Ceratobasidium sp. AG-Ba]|nr:Zinc finger, NF-X1-type [Ceratobasidium sp. AG-Ba]